MAVPSPSGPSEDGSADGLAYDLWLPDARPPWPAMVILHGAGSRKENHGDFAAPARRPGWAALAYDQRGHGDSRRRDVARGARRRGAMAGCSADSTASTRAGSALRGSSLGGFVAIHAAAVEPRRSPARSRSARAGGACCSAACAAAGSRCEPS